MLLTWKKTLLERCWTINIRETITSVEFKKQKVKELKEKWSEKRIHQKNDRES